MRLIPRSVLSVAIAAFLALTPALFSKAAHASDPAAEKFVNDVSQKAISLLSDKSLSRPQLEASFKSLLNEHAAMEKIAVFALGQFRRLPNAAQQAEYLNLFDQFVTRIYVVRLSDYRNEKLEVTGSGPAKGGAMVNSRITFTTGRPPITIRWWLFKEGDSYKVFDLNVEGIWLAQEQRAAFSSVINNNKGDFNALLNHIKTQIANPSAAQ